MRQFRAALARFAGLFRRQRADNDLHEELQAHLDMEIAENIRRGMSPEEARRQALVASGGLAVAAEAVRDQRGLPWLEAALADLRYAVRALRHSPAFTAVVVLTLALGIGANTAIFSVVRGVLLKPLPHRDGDRLVYLRHSKDGRENVGFSVPEVSDYRTGAPALGGIAEYCPWSETLQDAEGAFLMDVGLVTGNFFEVMGLRPVLGRLTRPGDDGPGVAPVMVLTHEYWLKRFGGDSTIVGRTVRLDAGTVTVIGVLQPAPYFPDRVDAFLNMVISPHHLSAQMIQGRTHRMTEMIARLAPGATVAQARAEVAAVDARVRQDYPDAYDPGSHFRVSLLSFRDALGERARAPLWLLMGTAAFVMIIAVANVANLTLMRGVRREHELLVRAALGAGVGRLRRLLLAENLLLAVIGGLLGVLVASAGVRLLIAMAQRYSPRAGEIHLDLVVLGFALALSVGVALVLSFVAALPRDGALAAWISAGGRATGGLRRQHLQRALVVAQVAVSVVLLAGAGLLVRTMVRLADVDTGFTTEQVLTMPVPLLNFAHIDATTDATNKTLYDSMRREIAALPGVEDVGLGSTMPLRASMIDFDVKAEDRPLAPGEAIPHADLRTASPEYFHAAGIPLERGRLFAATDDAHAARVVVVNRTFADRLFPGEDPIGKRIAWTGDVLRFTPITSDWRTIVGVVGNTQDGGLDEPPRAVVFEPFLQEFAMLGGLVIRTAGDPAALANEATHIVRSIAPTVPLENVLTVKQIKDQSVAPRRLNAELVSSFGLLAVLIAAVGIAGVLAFSVSARTNEIGIRMSLGADGSRIQRMILGEGGRLLAIGLALGIGGAYVAAGMLRGLLFGIAPRDPVTFLGVAGIMLLIGLVACWIPALRAARIDPAISMRAT